ncbi:sigma-54 dependent transcriptional regulator [Cupriavidus basilensis]|uniref:Sigma-54 dependent transcriptional regulator n=1 Tax=Cupriavidus basilensis TaxID=68895 RepID=A0ABT6B3S3_9BURK|nr:sigma-54 dependent transcriptional regulator [Cupriavidus basilensis]MDF3839541.1 sigma-54 dependent transcriptional regulator [Cupriavidus basilensis]
MQLLSWPLPAPRPLSHVFADPKSLALLSHAEKVAPSEAGILIVGETGTGKEMVARHVHNLSARRNRRFVAVNCGAFSESLVDAELFGHEKGAFTGALGAKAGWFEEADGGTLFLDEIGDLPMSLQVKLLRVLQEREVVRLGSRKPVPIDVRVLAATNRPLEAAIRDGTFRKDLFYRLNVVALEIRPLHERPGDILPLAQHFLCKYGERLGYGEVGMTGDAERKLVSYPWPGNIRELENVLHHALLTCQDSLIGADDLHVSAPPEPALPPKLAAAQVDDEPAQALLERAVLRLFEQEHEGVHEIVENALLRAAYRHCRYNQVHTASLLGLSRNITRARLIQIGELRVNRRKAGEPDEADTATGEPRMFAIAI